MALAHGRTHQPGKLILRYMSPKDSSVWPRILRSAILACTLGAATSSVHADQATPAATPPRTYDFSAALSASESYVDNSEGLAGGSRSDFVTSLGFDAHYYERSRRTVFSANYSFGADFYANGSQATQIRNNLLALGSIEAIPEHLVLTASAFASPVIVSNLGIATAGNRVVANGYQNSFGFSVGPVLRFRFGDFATSETSGLYGSTFFSRPAGSTPVVIIPGVPGPEDTISRSAFQQFSSGEYFERLQWTATGVFSETKRKQGLLSEKAGIGALRYALSHEVALLGTVGYDAISDTIPLKPNVSGLVALGGVAVTLGANFSFELQGGRKYNNTSFIGDLRYNLSPKTAVVGSLTDTVTTPEGQLLASLTNLTVTPNGTLTSSSDLLGDGTPASLATFGLQSPGSFGFDQNISRYQTGTLSFLEDFERNHVAFSFFASRRTILSGVFVGPPVTNSWGGSLNLARDISPRTVGTIGTSYTIDEELGGRAESFRIDGQVSYSLSRQMGVYLRADYLDRNSSSSLSALSPFAGSLTDYQITIGVSRTL